MSVTRGRAARGAGELDRIAARLARGAALSPEDVRQVLAGLRAGDRPASLDAALTQWLDHDAAAARDGSTVVAEIPPPTARPGPELRASCDGSAHGERIRALRTELLMRRRADDREALAILGLGAGEGRSRLAAELAIAFAQTGEPTLLVDADLRHPRQAALFGADEGSGLAEALEHGGPAQLQGVHDLPQLALVTAGATPTNPLERLSSPRLGELLAGWRRHFRHVIIDTPPAGAYADALAVAMHGNAVLVVARAGRTRVDGVRELLRRLALTPARVLGSVVTRF